MEYSKKNPGEGWRREMKKTRAALKDEKTYIHVPLMKKKSTKVTKAKSHRTFDEAMLVAGRGIADKYKNKPFQRVKVHKICVSVLSSRAQ